MFIRVREIQNEDERAEVYRFRYSIYSEELHKNLTGMDHESRIYRDDLDAASTILAAVEHETGRIVGTIRTARLSTPDFPEDMIQRLDAKKLVQALDRSRVSYSSALMVDPSYRGKTVTSLMVNHFFRQGMEQELMADLCICELALVHLYQQLGYRAYHQGIRSYSGGGLRIPMVLTVRDRGYLEKVRSPLLPLLDPDLDDRGETAARLRELYPDFLEPEVNPKEQRALWAAIAHPESGRENQGIFRDFLPEEVTTLVRPHPKILLKQGEQLYTTGEVEKGMGVILSGRLGVTFEDGENPHFVTLLGPGQICGEMSMLLGSSRTANMVAIEDSEILVVPHNLLDRVSTSDASTGVRLYRNLSISLASRLFRMNRQAAMSGGHVSGGPSGTEDRPPRVREPGRSGPLEQSYDITTLEDPGRELARLERQAGMGREIEAFQFMKAGFRDRSTFLDLGSGPGLTSMMLAGLYPESRILGIEPEAMLRDRARDLASVRGLGDRCRFLEGRGEALPLGGDSVDFCYARFVFQHLPKPLPVLQELARVTRSGGVVLVADVDDEGVIIQPEPRGFRDFQQRSAQAQQTWGGDRMVGRKLLGYMKEAGLQRVRTDVAMVTSQEVDPGLLVDAVFSFKEQTLKRTGLWKPEDEEVFQELREASTRDDSWFFVPVFFTRGVKA